MPAQFLIPLGLSALQGSADATNQRRQFQNANRRNLFSVFQGPRADNALAASLIDNSAKTLSKGVAGAQTSFDQTRLQQQKQDRNNRILSILESRGLGSSIPQDGDAGFVGPPRSAANNIGSPVEAQSSSTGFTSSNADTLLRFLSGLKG